VFFILVVLHKKITVDGRKALSSPKNFLLLMAVIENSSTSNNSNSNDDYDDDNALQYTY
jgi:hypothetical protein